MTNVFSQSLRDLGYVDGQTISVQYRFYAGETKRLPGIMAELVGRRVDVIVAADGASSHAAKQATNTVPMVAISMDPVREGLVGSLARQGGNVTGFATGAIVGKRLQFLQEIVLPLATLAAFPEHRLAQRMAGAPASASTTGSASTVQPISNTGGSTAN